MIYHRGKIRCIAGTVLAIPRWCGIRCNSTTFSPTSTETTSHIHQLMEEESIATKLINAFPSIERRKSTLKSFVGGDFHKFENLTKPIVKPQRVLPPQTQYQYDGLDEYLKANQVKRAFALIKTNYLNGNYLTTLEFQSLFIQLLPFSWYACRLLQMYDSRLNYTQIGSKVQVLLMKVAFDNFRYIIFDKIFKAHQLRNERLSDEILLSAMQVYLKTENIQIATQLFNQHVMTETNLPNRLLDVYLSNLYNRTKNSAMCFTSYRLWVSKNLDTNTSIDSFVYNLLLEAGMLDEIEWMENSLKQRGLFDKFVIKFGTVCNQLSKNYEEYQQFITSDDLKSFEDLAEADGETPSLVSNLTYLHLRHKNYQSALDNFESITSRKALQLSIFSLLRHFEKEENPELIFALLQKLREEAKFRIHWTHILIYWRTLIRKYPHLGFEIHALFKNRFKRSKYHRLSFMSYMFQVRGQTSSDQTDETRCYPVVKYNDLKSALKPLHNAPDLASIESRLRSGIFPNTELLRKSIKFTNDRREFARLVEIANQMKRHSMVKTLNVKLNIDIFFKECTFKYSSSSLRFARDQIEMIERLNYADDSDLIELFRFCVKFQLYDESLIVLNMFEKFNIEIVGDQKVLKFISLFIKWCWFNRKFRELVIILEWLKVQECITIDEFFWVNLRDSANKFALHLQQDLDQSLREFMKCSSEDAAIKKQENEKLKELLPQLMSYYNETLEDVRERKRNESKKIVSTSSENFEYLANWVDEDTETIFEGEWE